RPDDPRPGAPQPGRDGRIPDPGGRARPGRRRRRLGRAHVRPPSAGARCPALWSRRRTPGGHPPSGAGRAGPTLAGPPRRRAGPHWTVAGLRPYAEVVLDAFGPARVMFGSDWPVCLLAASYADVTSAAQELTAALTREEQALVFGGTATRVYGLSAAGT